MPLAASHCAWRGRVRDLLRTDGMSDKVGGPDRAATLDSLLGGESG